MQKLPGDGHARHRMIAVAGLLLGLLSLVYLPSGGRFPVAARVVHRPRGVPQIL